MRVAVAGLGWWGKQIVRSLHPSTKLDVVCGVDPYPPPDARAFTSEFSIDLETSLDAVLRRADVDGVILATPHSLHEEQVLAVVRAGKEVFCEKPLAMTGDSARRMLDAVDGAGRVLGIGHERRFEPAVMEIFRMVRAGELGRLLHLEANISHDLFRNVRSDNWRLDPEHAPAGLMTAVGIHVTDIFVALAGPARSVRAVTDSMVLSPPAQDYVSATIDFASGARGTLTFLSATPFHGRMAIFGDRGWVELVSEGNVDKGKPTILTTCFSTDGPWQRRVFAANDAVLANLEAWADGVAKRATYPFPRAELSGNVELFEAIVRSAGSGGATVTLAG